MIKSHKESNTKFNNAPLCEIFADALSMRLFEEQTDKNALSEQAENYDGCAILFVTEGEATLFRSDKRVEVKAPFVAVFSSIVSREQIKNIGLGHKRYIMYSQNSLLKEFTTGDELKTFVFEQGSVCAMPIEQSEANILEGLFETAVALENDDENMRYAIIKMIIQRISKIPTGIDVFNETVQQGVGKKYFGELIDYIAENFDEKLSLGVLANHFYVSRTKLAKDFVEIMGMSVGQYILKVRIDKAKELLLENVPISSVAQDCGFASTSYFIQSFKKITGKTPLNFAEQAKKWGKTYETENTQENIVRQDFLKV